MPESMHEEDRVLSLVIGGISVVVFILLLAAFSLSSEKNLFNKDDDYYVIAYYKEIGMLQTGASVKFGGVQIGHVTEVDLQDDQTIKVEVRMYIDRKIPRDSRLVVSATTVSGDSFLDLVLGKDPEDIEHSSNSFTAPVLQGINFISIKNIGSAFSGAQKSATELFGYVDRLFNTEAFIPTEIKKIQQLIPGLASKYLAFDDRKILLLEKVGTLQKKISEVQRQAAETTAECSTVLSSEHISEGISSITKAANELNTIISTALDSQETAEIKKNFNKISSWANSLKLEKESILGVIMSDGECSTRKTIAKVAEAVEKVQDFSLFKKLGFYFKGKSLLAGFEEKTNSQYLTASRYMYNWSLFSYRRNLHNCDLPCGEKSCPNELK